MLTKTVYRSSQVRAYLDSWQSDGDYLFPASCNTQPISSQRLGAFWCHVRQLASLEGVRLHDLRHTFASYAVLEGYPLTMVSKLLGHTRLSSTLRYAHVNDAQVSYSAQIMGDKIRELLVGKLESKPKLKKTEGEGA